MKLKNEKLRAKQLMLEGKMAEYLLVLTILSHSKEV